MWIFELNYLVWIDDHRSVMLFGVTQAQHKVDHIFRKQFRGDRGQPRWQIRVPNESDAAVRHLLQAYNESMANIV